jgi:O-antigen ligase
VECPPSPAFAAAKTVILCVLFAMPLAFGAVEPWAWGLAGLATVCAFLLWLLGNLRTGVLRFQWSPLHSMGLLYLLLASTQYIFGLTRDSASTRESILKFASDFLLFFLAGQLWCARATPVVALPPAQGIAHSPENCPKGLEGSARSPEKPGHLAVLANCVSLYVFGLSLFAILQFFSSPGLIYWRIRPRWGGWIFGPYVNHNHFAGLMEMLIPVAAAWALAQVAERPFHVLRPAGRAHLAPWAWPVGAVLTGVIAVMLSGSRGGLISLLIEGLIFIAVLAHRRLLPRRHPALAAAAISCAILFCWWLVPANVAQRLETVAQLPRSPEATLGERQAVARDTLHMFQRHWLTGTGLGSFETAFPPYLTFASDLTWQHAHNDYLENLAETGVIGGLLMAAALGIFLVWALRNLRIVPQSKAEWSSHPSDDWIRLGAMAGCLGILAHSLVDFNLHIPANAAWFAVLAGLATRFPAGRIR